MTTVALDACSIINLHNANMLEEVVSCLDFDFRVSPIVLGECGPECAAVLLKLGAAGRIIFVPDAEIPVERFLALLALHSIGDGEIETIAVCEATDWVFCSDDAAARRLGAQLLADDRVVGSLRLLRLAVEAEKLSCGVAFDSYETMLATGGFLPKLSNDFFCAGLNAC